MYHKAKEFLYECRQRYELTKIFVQRYWKSGLALSIAVFIIMHKDVAIDLSLDGTAPTQEVPEENSASWLNWKAMEQSVSTFFNEAFAGKDTELPQYKPGQYTNPVNTSMLDQEGGNASKLTSLEGEEHNLANTFSNMTFSMGDFTNSEEDRARAEKIRKQLKYVKAYAKIAQREMEEFGIPASITLAQGLLESNAGESALATRNKNHFGIKCFSKSCRKNHCSNFTDDHHKDFFRIYKTPEESYRAHSRLLGAKRYRKLFDLAQTDYRNWAKELKKAGYATDPHYAGKLINLIEELDLYKYDY